jgi:thiol-disulfide isomerase/thioredoxin
MRTRFVTALLVITTTGVLARAADPDPKTILKEATAAMKALKTVRYEAHGQADGILAVQIPGVTGWAAIERDFDLAHPKVRLTGDVKYYGRDDASKLEIACDGAKVDLIGHDRNVYLSRELPQAAVLFERVVTLYIREFALADPFTQERGAVQLKYVGTAKIGDEECDVILAVLNAEGGQIEWAFSRKDHLPRRVKRYYPTPAGDLPMTVEITKLEADIEIPGGMFALKQPEGYSDPQAQKQETKKDPNALVAAGSVAPDWTLKDSDGKEVSLKGLRGKVVLLDFWATWCVPCRRAMPVLERLHKKYADKPVKVYGVNCWERNKSANPVKFLKDKGLTYPTLLEGSAVAKEYNVRGIPALVLIGPDGKILSAHAGLRENDEKNLAKLIDTTLKAMQDGSQAGAAEPSDKAG